MTRLNWQTILNGIIVQIYEQEGREGHVILSVTENTSFDGSTCVVHMKELSPTDVKALAMTLDDWTFNQAWEME